MVENSVWGFVRLFCVFPFFLFLIFYFNKDRTSDTRLLSLVDRFVLHSRSLRFLGLLIVIIILSKFSCPCSVFL
jgi:hypothetical protein